MRRTALLLCLVPLLSGSPLHAQVQSRPTEPPAVTAAGESWFVNRVPIIVGGEVYFPAGAAVFFDRNTMVRSGSLAGVPLYIDTTVEPFSTLLVPGARGLMQPYERRREGSLAGTTGSRAPSFPVQATPGSDGTLLMAPASPLTASATGSSGFEEIPLVPPPDTDSLTQPVITAAPLASRTTGETRSAMRPESNDGVWISWDGRRWVSDGPAVPIAAGMFTRVGDYAGFPILTRPGAPRDVIFIPTRAGLVAPYRLKP